MIMNFLVMPIFFLSGALYPLNNLPAALSIVTSLDPLAYGVDGLRGRLIGISHFGLAADAAVLLVVCDRVPLGRQPPVFENPSLIWRERGAKAAHRKVIDAALELVADRGVDGASMDAIAARSGVSKATIYKHWEDKDALLLEMHRRLERAPLSSHVRFRRHARGHGRGSGLSSRGERRDARADSAALRRLLRSQ